MAATEGIGQVSEVPVIEGRVLWCETDSFQELVMAAHRMRTVGRGILARLFEPVNPCGRLARLQEGLQ